MSLSELTGFRPGAKLKIDYETTVDSITMNSNGWNCGYTTINALIHPWGSKYLRCF